MKNIINIVRCIAYTVLFVASGCTTELENPDRGENGTPATRAQANGKYYYSFDEKIYLEEIPDKIVLRYNNDNLTGIEQYLSKLVSAQDMMLNMGESIAILAIDSKIIEEDTFIE